MQYLISYITRVKTGHLIGSTARTFLALTFLFSGFVKAVDPLGTVYKIEDYLKAFGGFFTDLLPLAGVAAVCLIAFEWLLGWTMLLNIRTRLTSWLALVFMLIMTPLTLWIALTNPVTDCGCFGDAWVLTNWETFWKNIILLGLVLVLLVCRKAIPQLFSGWAELVLALIGLGIAGGIMAYSYTHLPPMDFRPYKIGNHIPTLMEVPEDAAPDIYQTTLIYEKDGVQQEFTLENYPKGDPEWRFVDQRSVLIQKGYVAPIHDFEIITMGFDDITYAILASEEPVALIIIYDIKKMDRSQLDKVAAIIHERSKVYILTGSGEDDIEELTEELGWDEETMESTFCYTDPVTLKTIVRANPGLVIIKNGTILEKYNFKQL